MGLEGGLRSRFSDKFPSEDAAAPGQGGDREPLPAVARLQCQRLAIPGRGTQSQAPSLLQVA